MTMYLERSIECPGHEFGLEPCEERIWQKAVNHPASFEDPGELVADEDSDTLCGCDRKVLDERAFWTRVWELMEKEDWEPDTDDSAYL